MPPAPIRAGSAPRRAWGPAGECAAWPLVAEAALHVTEERMPPDSSETAHRHGAVSQAFYVLDGVLWIDREGERLRLAPGDLLHVPAGTAHRAFTAQDPARFLVIADGAAAADRAPA